jgi:hypothetical protein
MYKTLSGLEISEAFKKLDEDLGSKAYKTIKGGKGGKLGLTDIVPAYLPEKLTQLFGVLGLGWGFDVITQETTNQKVTRNGGYEEVEFTSTAKVCAWYSVIDDKGIEKKINLPTLNGSSSNTVIEWAEKGAVTNALGTIWFFAGYQISIYKGLKDKQSGKVQITKPTVAVGYEPSIIPPEKLKPCDKCGEIFYLRDGKFGKFYSCAGYRKGCKRTIKLEDAEMWLKPEAAFEQTFGDGVPLPTSEY